MSGNTRVAVARLISIGQVVVPENRKRLVTEIAGLAASIKALGLLNPITVTKGGVLIAGLHRLRACEALGWTEIPAYEVDLDEVDAELAEIDENLCRTELSALERSEQTARRKVLYEARYPETKKGSAQGEGRKRAGKGGGLSESVSPSSFTEDTAKHTGKSKRSVEQDVQIGAQLPAKVRDTIRGTPLEDQKRELLALVRLKDEAKQVAVAELIVSGGAKTVAAAVKRLGSRKSEANAEAVCDQTGREVSDPVLAEAFTELRPAVRSFIRQTRAGLRELVELPERRPREVGRRLRKARDYDALHQAEDAIRTALDTLSLREPYAACPLCKGADPKCPQCGGGSWVNKRTLELYLQTLHGGRLPKGATRG